VEQSRLRSGVMVGYLAASGTARLADEMVAVAVVLLVLERTGSTAAAGAVVAGYTLPSLVAGPVLGAWLDRTAHRRFALAGNGLLLGVASLGLILTTGRAPLIVPVAIAAVAGCTLPLTSGGYSSLVPSLVSTEDELRRAAGLDAATFNVAAIGGPGLAGLLAASSGTAAAMAAITVLACAGAGCTMSLPKHTPAGAVPPGTLVSRVAAGFRHLAGSPPLRGATITTVLGLGSVGMLTVALPRHTEELGAGAAAAGYLWTCVEVGALVATVFLWRRLGHQHPERIVFVCTALSGLGIATWPLAPGLTALLVLAAMAGFAEGSVLPAIISARHRYTPDDLLAQVATTGASMKIGAFALGSLAGGALVSALGSAGTILTVAALHVVATAIGLAAAR
jgi:MFS family permease